jgi:hypothetical protein
MRHRANGDFWDAFEALPAPIRDLAGKSFQQLKDNPKHPSLQFKKVGPYWSARVGAHYRALAVERDYGFLWFWIGSHAEYDRLIR